VVVPNPVLQDLGLLKNALSACFSADTFLDVKLISPFGRTADINYYTIFLSKRRQIIVFLSEYVYFL
ncbi:MAG: hypothetical protein IJU82_08040, partial [Ruminiclostridium sp.]|nr:hypothetical protein [Ruminiclostridium sp.]